AVPEDDRRLVAHLEDEVRDDEQGREDAGQAEQRGDLALRALLGALVDVSRTGLVLVQARVGDRVADRVDRGHVVAEAVVAHGLIPFFERTELDAIQTAKATQAPMPTSQAVRPSLTGPSEPSEVPP